MRNILNEYIFEHYDKGHMRDYHKDHFLIRATNGDSNILNGYEEYFDQKLSADFSSSFIINLSFKLKALANIFSEDDVSNFITNQLAAGKNNYNQNQFFEALSEVQVLFYLGTFFGKIKAAFYEPKLGLGDANPEARFVLEDDTVVDVEVKTGQFVRTVNREKGKNGAIKPNMALTREDQIKLRKFCEENEIQLIFPRILKIKDFIESSAKKFEYPTTKRHYNLLFINWTYTDFPMCSVNEPLSIFCNTQNGIFYNNAAIDLIGLRRKDIDKISAVVLYQDNINTLLTTDFRFHFQNKTFKYLVNKVNHKGIDFSYLSENLSMNAHNTRFQVEWYPYDYHFGEGKNKLQEDFKKFFMSNFFDNKSSIFI